MTKKAPWEILNSESHILLHFQMRHMKRLKEKRKGKIKKTTSRTTLKDWWSFPHPRRGGTFGHECWPWAHLSSCSVCPSSLEWMVCPTRWPDLSAAEPAGPGLPAASATSHVRWGQAHRDGFPKFSAPWPHWPAGRRASLVLHRRRPRAHPWALSDWSRLAEAGTVLSSGQTKCTEQATSSLGPCSHRRRRLDQRTSNPPFHQPEMLGFEVTGGCGCLEIKGDVEGRCIEEEFVICAGPSTSPIWRLGTEMWPLSLENRVLNLTYSVQILEHTAACLEQSGYENLLLQL